MVMATAMKIQGKQKRKFIHDSERLNFGIFKLYA